MFALKRYSLHFCSEFVKSPHRGTEKSNALTLEIGALNFDIQCS